MNMDRSGLVAAVSIAAVIVGMAMPQMAQAKDADGKWVIAVALQSEQEPIWHLWVQTMEAEAERLNARILVQYANRDPAKQAAQVEQLLAQQPDAFIFNPAAGGGAAAPTVDAILAEGIPIVAFDDLLPHTTDYFLVTRDNYQVGVLQAQEALKFAPSGNYAFVKGSPAWFGYQQIVQGYEDTFKDTADINVVFDQNADWDPAKAQAHAENALTANNDDLQAIVTMNDGMATGVVAAVKSRNLGGKVYVSGLDSETQALKSILDGGQTMSVYTDIEDYGRSAVQAAVQLANGETPESNQMTATPAGEVPTHLVPIMAVTKENLCDTIQNKMIEGWTSVEAVFGNVDACN